MKSWGWGAPALVRGEETIGPAQAEEDEFYPHRRPFPDFAQPGTGLCSHCRPTPAADPTLRFLDPEFSYREPAPRGPRMRDEEALCIPHTE